MKIAVKPTIFVALGGTGAAVVNNVRRRLEQRVGTADLPFFRWVYMDTQADTLERQAAGLRGKQSDWTNTCRMDVSAETIARLRNPDLDNGQTRRQLDIDQWFDADALAGLSGVEWRMGVGGRRMYGRLGFLAGQTLGSLVNAITDFRQQLARSGQLTGRALEEVEPPYMRIIPESVAPEIDIVAVTSGGGGTGSGCFIDFGYLLRELRDRNGWSNIRQHGYALLAQAGMGTPNHRRNSAGLLIELHHYRSGGGATYGAGYLQLPFRCESHDPPYDMAFAVQPTQQDVPLHADSERAFELLEWRTAEAIVNHALCMWDDDAPAGDVKLPLDEERTQFLGDMGQNPRGLQTLGVDAVEFPAGLVHRHLYGVAVRTLAERWTQVDASRKAQAVNTLRELLGLADPTTAANKSPRNPDTDGLKSQLLADCGDVKVLQHIAVAKADIPSAEALRKGTPAPTEEKMLAVREHVRIAFQQRQGPPVGGQPGMVYATLATNTEQLLDLRHERSVALRLASTILDVAASVPGGPATAAAVAEDLGAMTAREIGFIDECLSGLGIDDPHGALNLKAHWQYANDMLLSLVLEHKRRVLQKVEPWLDELASRMGHLTDYIREWAATMPRAEELQVIAECPATILPSAVVGRLESRVRDLDVADLSAMDAEAPPGGRGQPGLIRQLRELVRRGLPREDPQTKDPTLFADGPPKVRGQIDFRPMQVFEHAVFRAIEQGTASPYREEVLTLLQAECQQADRRVPNMRESSRPLLNYNFNHQDYQALNFNGNPTRCLEVVQPDQAGFEWYDPAQQDTWSRDWPGEPRHLRLHNEMPRLNRQVVLHESIRCSIIWEFLRGYDRDSLASLWRQGDHPAISDKRIPRPPSERDRLQAEMLLFGSLILKEPRIWEYQGLDRPFHRITYQHVDRDGRPVKREFWAPQQFPEGVTRLALDPDAMVGIDQRVRQYVEQDRGPAARAIEDAGSLLDERYISAARPGSEEGFEGHLVEYNLDAIRYHDALLALWRFAEEYDVPQARIPHPFATRPEEGGTWRCRQCGHDLGATMPAYTSECPRCKAEREARRGEDRPPPPASRPA